MTAYIIEVSALTSCEKNGTTNSWEAVWEYHLHALRSTLLHRDELSLGKYQISVKRKSRDPEQNVCVLRQVREFFQNRRYEPILPLPDS